MIIGRWLSSQESFHCAAIAVVSKYLHETHRAPKKKKKQNRWDSSFFLSVYNYNNTKSQWVGFPSAAMSIEYAVSQIIYLRRLLKLTVTPATVSFSQKSTILPTHLAGRNESSGFCFHMKWPFCANSFCGCVSHRDPSLIELTQINTPK